MAALALRGHHLLCLPGFRGYGYSPEHAAALGRWAISRLFGESKGALPLWRGGHPPQAGRGVSPWELFSPPLPGGRGGRG